MHAFGEPAEVARLIGLVQVFSPAQAAEVLRSIGLDDITECALRTRAYRKQIPFHLNGHRITFAVADLQEIAQGIPCRPAVVEAGQPREAIGTEPAKRKGASAEPDDAWRARRPRHA